MGISDGGVKGYVNWASWQEGIVAAGENQRTETGRRGAVVSVARGAVESCRFLVSTVVL